MRCASKNKLCFIPNLNQCETKILPKNATFYNWGYYAHICRQLKRKFGLLTKTNSIYPYAKFHLTEISTY